MAIEFLGSKNIFTFQFFKDKKTSKQNSLLFASIILLVVGVILVKKFGYSELALLPFSICLFIYGSLIISSQKMYAGLLVYTGLNAQRMGVLYILFGLLITAIIMLFAYS